MGIQAAQGIIAQALVHAAVQLRVTTFQPENFELVLDKPAQHAAYVMSSFNSSNCKRQEIM